MPFKVLDAPTTEEAVKQLESLCGTHYDKALIASPTETHEAMCHACIRMRLPFLVEKPFTKSVDSCLRVIRHANREKLINNFVVNNYWFAFDKMRPVKQITYRYYKTGHDGLEWDLCQLIHYAAINGLKLKTNTTSPVWTLRADNKQVPYWLVEMSYIDMIENWLTEQDKMLTLVEGMEMTESVVRAKNESIDRHPSA